MWSSNFKGFEFFLESFRAFVLVRAIALFSSKTFDLEMLISADLVCNDPPSTGRYHTYIHIELT